MALAKLGIATVAAITVICYVIGMIVKNSRIDDKWIPVIVCIAGGLLGFMGLHLMAGFPADNAIDAIAVGIVSGGMSTCIDQIDKQLNGEKGDEQHV